MLWELVKAELGADPWLRLELAEQRERLVFP